MLRNPLPAIVLIALTLAAPAFGQALTVTMSPNPVPTGGLVTVTAQTIVPGIYTPFGCLVTSVRSGHPNGPTVQIFPCTFLPGAIPSCGSTTFRMGQWTANQPAGHYWIEIQHQPQMFGGPITTEWFCVTVENPINPVPALSAVNSPLFNSAFELSLFDAAHPGAPYAVALAATTNTGIPYVGGHVALDADFLLQVSLMQDPGVFVNFSGFLDVTGQSPQIFLNIPPVPGVTCLPIHAQAAVLLGASSFVLSNALPITIH